jgi:hypothetical protein
MADPLNPFDYAERFNPRRQDRPVAEIDDAVTAEIKRMRENDLRMDIAVSPPADQVARTSRLARQAGLPPAMVEDRADEIERGLNAQAMAGLANRYPAIGRWAATNPRAAVSAQDDHESLGLIGEAFEGLKKIGRGVIGNLEAGAYRSVSGLREITDPIANAGALVTYGLEAGIATVGNATGLFNYDPDRIDKAMGTPAERRAADRARMMTEGARLSQEAQTGNWYVDAITQGLQSVPVTLAAAATRNPSLMLAAPAASVAGNEYREARDQGLDPVTAIRYGVTQGTIEAITEKIPAERLASAIANKTPFGRAFIQQIAAEMPGEQVATVLQDFTQWVYLNPGKTLSEFIAERPDAALATALGTIGGVGAQTGTISAVQRAADVTSKVAGRIEQARQAKQQAQTVDQIGKAVQSSKLSQRDPEALAQFVRDAANDAGSTHVMIDAQAVQAYLQSDSYDQYSDPLRHYTDQINEAAAAGGDLVLPVEVALGSLPGSPAWAALKDDMRLTPGGMSAREATTFEESMADIVAELSDQMDRAEQETKANRTAIEKLTVSVQDKLQNAGFTPYVARQQAELIAQRTVTRAQRLGREITGNEFDTEVRQVLPPALSAARKADATDLVINALRKGGDAMQQGGDSLLQFIAKRGGINDTGGDLASMGLDKWHLKELPKGTKDKKGRAKTQVPIAGRRKLIRDFDPRQASMGGISGAGDYGLDSTLRAAIDAGYFPELQGDGQISDEAAIMLQAISEELAGSPRYAQEARVDNMRAAAEELRSLLSERGLDPAQMTDAELRAEIEKLDEAGPDGGYEQITPEQAKDTNVAVELPTDPLFAEAVANTPGAEITPDGLLMDVVRVQKPDQEGAYSVRTGVFYLPKGSPNLRHYRAAGSAYGGSERFEGQTLLRRPLFVKGATGGKAPEAAYDAIKGKGAFAKFERELMSAVTSRSALGREQGLFEENIYNFLGEHGGDPDMAYEIIRNSAKGNQLRYALQEHVIAHVVRDAGYDSVLGYSKGKKGAALSEVFDLREITYPAKDFESEIHHAYFQSFGEGPRGRIVFPEGGFGTGPSIIELFKDRNLSTMTHELGHQWLEELRYDASAEDAPDQLKADWQTVQDWFASQGHPVTDGVIPVEAHEMFARGVERYMLEGKSPSTALQRLFETFRGWLVAIYKTVDRLRAPISPEIREVMDRLIATDEEIAQARDEQALNPLFTDAAAVGMTGPEFDAYTTQVQNARGEAQGKLLEKTMAAIRRRETEQYRERRAGVETEVRESVDARPLYRSLAAMKDTPVSQQWLVDRMGQDVLALLPKRVPPIYRDGGAHPDAIAEMAGYGSGEEMINDLIGAEAQHRQAKEGGDQRSMRERTIATETDAEMNRRYGDTLNDGSIEREALAAVHNEMQGEVIVSEIRVLARRTGKRATPYAIARQWARQKVRQGVYTEEASPAAIQRHARAVAKAGREAEKAMLAGNVDDAFRFKQQQMLSSALLAEAKEANDDAGKAVRRMNRIARAQTMKSVDQEYLEQAHALLDAVQLRERTQKSIERQGKWAAWAEARAAEGYDVVVPPSFEAELGKTHWTRLPVETLLGLDEAVKQVVHLGRLKQTLLDNQERREWEEIYTEVETAGRNIQGPPPQGLEDPNWWDAIKSKVAGADAALLKLETLFDWLDGGNPNGVFNRIAFRPVADAQAREQDMLKDYYARVRALFDAVPEKIVQSWTEKVSPPFVDPFTGRPAVIQRQKLIAMALNIGNEGNLQRLSDGYGWNANAITEYLASELTAEEWQFVQGTWDVIETLWPEIEAMERRINGVAPDKVEAREVVTPHGTFRGGYYPAIYDSRLDRKAKGNAEVAENRLFEPNAVRATTRASATKNRSETVSRPIALDLGVLNRHLGEVIHDITHREAVMQAWKFLSSERVQRAADEALGGKYTDQFKPWVKFVANSWAMERAGNESFGAFLGKMRANATAVGLGLRATTMVTQIAGYSNSTEIVGAKHMALGIAQFSAHPVESFRFVAARSGEVRHRMDTLDRDIRTELARMAARNPVTKGLAKADEARAFMFHGIGLMDRAVVVPTWIGAYNKALEAGMSEEDAAYSADKAVRQSQGAGGPKDLAAIQRGTGRWGEAFKLMTMFYSYFSAFYQRERTFGRDIAGDDVRRPRDVPKLAARAFFLFIVPPLLTELLKMPFGAGGPDDDEWWAQWTMRKLISNVLGPIPLARDLFEPAWVSAVGGQAFNPQISPINRALSSIVTVAKDAGKAARGEETKAATKHALEAAGYVTGLVPGQVASAAQFLVDVGYGDADPRDFSDWIEGLSTGKIKD